MNFFHMKSLENPNAVWRILNISGYRNHLQMTDEVIEEETV